MKFPLPLRITIPVALFSIGLLFGTLSFVSEVTSAFRRIEADVSRQATTLGHQVSEMLRYHVQTGDTEAAARQIALLGANPSVKRALVCDETNRVILSTQRDLRDKLLNETSAKQAKETVELARAKIFRELGTPSRISPRIDLSADRKTLAAAFPIVLVSNAETNGIERIDVLYLEYDLARLKGTETAEAIRRATLIDGTVALVCILVWFFFDRTLTRRVSHLLSCTQRLARGNLEAEACLRGSDELAEIGAAFNQMAERTRLRTAELEDANKKMKREIFEREQAENRFLSVWKSSVDGMRLTDHSGSIVAANEAYCRLVGLSAEDLEGKPFTICYHPEEISGMLATYRQRFANRSIETFIERQVKFRSRPEIADLEVASSFIAQDNEEPLLLSIFRDVTERKRAEELLNQQAASMKASMDGMAILDASGKYIYVNEAHLKIHGYNTAEELIGKSWEEVYEGNELCRFKENIMPAMFKTGHWRGEAIGKKRDGSSFPQEIALSRIETGGLVCVVRDITERRREESRRLEIDRKLLDAQKLESLGVMAGGIAHDFNNLLTAILGNASLALMRTTEVAPVRNYLANIEKTSLQAAELCKQMLAYSGRGKFVIQRLDINAFIRDMQQLLQISVNKRVTLDYRFGEKLPAVEVDPTQIRQVLMNLVINGSEAIGDNDGRVHVRTGTVRADRAYISEMYLSPELPEGDYVFVEVSDTGCGMSAETQKKIFEPFFTTKFTGRGLGLAAVLGIIRGHKGALKVESKLGAGTTFRFLIPCANAPAEQLAGEIAPNSDWNGSGTILVVDDEPTVRTVTSHLLEHLGFEVITADDGREGVETFAKNCDKIRAVILDMTMPHMNGEEAFYHMRRIRGDVQVILVSGYSEQDATTRFAGKGLAGFIQKPFKLDDLRNKLRSVLEKHP